MVKVYYDADADLAVLQGRKIAVMVNEIGDIAIHGEEAYPVEEALTHLSSTAQAEASPTTEEPVKTGGD